MLFAVSQYEKLLDQLACNLVKEEDLLLQIEHYLTILFLRLIGAGKDSLPVDNLHVLFYEIGTAILVVQIVSVLPNINAHQWCKSMSQRVIGVFSRYDYQLVVVVYCEPNPARTKKSYGYI